MRPKSGDKHHGICTECGQECTATFDSGIQCLDGPFGTMPQQVDSATWYSDCCLADAKVELGEPDED